MCVGDFTAGITAVPGIRWYPDCLALRNSSADAGWPTKFGNTLAKLHLLGHMITISGTESHLFPHQSHSILLIILLKMDFTS